MRERGRVHNPVYDVDSEKGSLGFKVEDIGNLEEPIDNFSTNEVVGLGGVVEGWKDGG